ncbi:MAG: D-isomer specific 2-hydroxyacid dehydrogenase family protein [Actinomycetota bacterium]
MPDAAPPVVSILPVRYPQIAEAVRQAGGVPRPPAQAPSPGWTDPSDPEQLESILIGSPARWVQLPFSGVDTFAMAGLLDPDRTWTSAKGIYGPMVAEHALALILTAARGLHQYAHRTTWTPPDEVPARRMIGQKVLVVGTGGIGRSLAKMLEPLEPTILAVNRSGRPMPGAQSTQDFTHLRDLVSQVDWVVLAAPLTAETHHLFDAELFGAMSRQAWLVNVARGEMVVTDALVEALASGSIAGAALDVTDPEPLPDGHPLWTMPNVVLTPHVANTWEMALPELASRVERNLIAFANGQPLEGLVDPALGY